jgi:hypothetical protein
MRPTGELFTPKAPRSHRTGPLIEFGGGPPPTEQRASGPTTAATGAQCPRGRQQELDMKPRVLMERRFTLRNSLMTQAGACCRCGRCRLCRNRLRPPLKRQVPKRRSALTPRRSFATTSGSTTPPRTAAARIIGSRTTTRPRHDGRDLVPRHPDQGAAAPDRNGSWVCRTRRCQWRAAHLRAGAARGTARRRKCFCAERSWPGMARSRPRELLGPR